MRIAGFVDNLVPYHHARWNAFARLSRTECSLIELSNRDEFSVLEIKTQAGRGYQRITLFENRDKACLSIRELAAKVHRVLSSWSPDVVCISGYATPLSLTALSWGSTARVPVVICSESNEFDEPRKWWREAIKRRLVRLCTAGLAGGSPQAAYLVRLGLPGQRVFKGYDVVDNEYFAREADRARQQSAARRGELRLPARYFLASARFTEKKNLPFLLRAFARYRAEFSVRETRSGESDIPWDLVLLGDGPLHSQLLTLRSELGAENCIHFAGARAYHDLPAFYGLASAFVHASTTEQWGLVVNEAMACGLPVLVSNRCGCVADLVLAEQNGFSFDPCDVTALAEIMSRISAPGFPLAESGAASREIISHWTPATFAKNLSLAIETALRNPRPRANAVDRALLCRLLHR
jgi:glycosyltransferase involved in cell wall biosynthesis